jgi:hypothetical protein
MLLESSLAVMIFMQIAACATTARQVDNPGYYPGHYRLFFPTSEHIVTNGRIPSLFVWEADRVTHFFGYLKGNTKWSNGYRETWAMAWQPIAGKQYALVSVELNPEQKSEDVTLEVKSLGDEMAITLEREVSAWDKPLQGGIAQGLAPIAVLTMTIWFSMLTYDAFFRATERPFDGCCFVWIADVETGETVSGQSPEGVTLLFSAES